MGKRVARIKAIGRLVVISIVIAAVVGVVVVTAVPVPKGATAGRVTEGRRAAMAAVTSPAGIGPGTTGREMIVRGTTVLVGTDSSVVLTRSVRMQPHLPLATKSAQPGPQALGVATTRRTEPTSRPTATPAAAPSPSGGGGVVAVAVHGPRAAPRAAARAAPRLQGQPPAATPRNERLIYFTNVSARVAYKKLAA